MDKMPISTDFTVLYFSIQKEADSSDPKFDNSKIELKPNETYRARFSLRVLDEKISLERLNLIGYKGKEIITFSPLVISPDITLENVRALNFTIEFKMRPTNQTDMNLVLTYQDDKSDMSKSTDAFENIIFFTNLPIKQGQDNNER